MLSECLVKPDSKREKYLMETTARALSESNVNGFHTSRNNDNDSDPAAGFAASSPNSSLSKLLSELSIMLGKLSPPLSARAHAGQSSQNEDLSDMKVGPELVKQANDLQNELHRFKVKSSEIAAKIQKDVDAVNSNINVNSLDLIKVQRELNIGYFLQCLHDLKSQLAKAKADVAILRNKQPSSPTSVKPDLNITSRQLKQSFYDMMQSKSFVKSDSKRERHLIETIARALSDSNESVNGIFTSRDIEGSKETMWNSMELLMQDEARMRNEIDRKLYQIVLTGFNTCLQSNPASYEIFKTHLIQAEFRANINPYEALVKIALRVMPHLDEWLLPGVYYVLGLYSFHQGKNEEAINWFQKIEKPNDYQKKARYFIDIAKRSSVIQKKEEGNYAFVKGYLEVALKLYIEALDINVDDDDINASLHYNKATVFAKLNRTREAEQACTVALHLKQDYIKALERRAQCCSELGEYEDAVEDYTRLVKLYNRENLPDRKIKDLLSEAEKVLEEFKRVDYYYKILGLRYLALSKDIKKCYYEKFRYYNPDKYSHAGPAVFARETRRAQQVTEAYRVIGDVSRRASYDRKQNRRNYVKMIRKYQAPTSITPINRN